MTLRKFDLILFDLGNTLIYFDGNEEDSSREAARAMTRELISCGYDLDPDAFAVKFQAAMRSYFTKRDADCLELTTSYVLREELIAAGFLNPPAADMRRALQAMYAVSEAHWKIGDDTFATLDALRAGGYRLGIISNAADGDDFHRLLEGHRLKPYFDLALVSAEVGMRKPHPLIFQLALDFYGVPAEKAAMVGDLPAMDIAGAQRMGIAGIWITRWLHPEVRGKSSAGITPDACVGALAELPETLAAWDGRNACP